MNVQDELLSALVESTPQGSEFHLYLILFCPENLMASDLARRGPCQPWLGVSASPVGLGLGLTQFPDSSSTANLKHRETPPCQSCSFGAFPGQSRPRGGPPA